MRVQDFFPIARSSNGSEGRSEFRERTCWAAALFFGFMAIAMWIGSVYMIRARKLKTRRNRVALRLRYTAAIAGWMLAFSGGFEAASQAAWRNGPATKAASPQEPTESPFKPEPSPEKGFGSGGFGSGGFGADESESEGEGTGEAEGTKGMGSGGFGSGGFGTGGFDTDSMNSAEGSSFGDGEIPDAAEHSLPVLEYSISKAKPSDYVGDEGGAQFIDKAPNGAMMVGMQVSISNDIFEWIQGVRPIYQRGNQLLTGEWHGKAGGQITTLMARPGFAVGGLLLRHGGSLKSIQVAFVAVRDDGRLNSKDYYLSDPVGDTQFGREFTINTEGRHVVGMFGRADDKVFGLGLAALRAAKAANQNPMAESGGNPAASSNGKEPYRTWTSSNGKFSVKAQFQLIDDDKVVLLREDGKTAVVEISKLCEADRQYLQGKTGSR